MLPSPYALVMVENGSVKIALARGIDFDRFNLSAAAFFFRLF